MVGLVSEVKADGAMSLILGVITPGFSFCAATSSTLCVEEAAGSRCIPSFSIDFLSTEKEVLGDVGSGLVGDVVASELCETGDPAKSAPFSLGTAGKGTPVSSTGTSSSCKSGVWRGSDSVSCNHSTWLHRETSLFVVSSASPKCIIFSQPSSFPSILLWTKILRVLLTSSRL